MADKLILDGIDCTGLPFQAIMRIFRLRHDSLCEEESPETCDCGSCPTKELCRYVTGEEFRLSLHITKEKRKEIMNILNKSGFYSFPDGCTVYACMGFKRIQRYSLVDRFGNTVVVTSRIEEIFDLY